MDTEDRDVIELFMWGFQKHMQISFQVSAESLFNSLDKEFDPKVFFVGVLIEDREHRHPICIEPDDTVFNVDHFKDVKKLATELVKVDRDARLWHSHPIAETNHKNRMKTRAYRDSILKTLERENSYGKEKYFVAYPTYIEGYLVFTILSLNKDILSKYYSLTKDLWLDRYSISRSFIESCINTFLNEATQSLKDPDTGIHAMPRRADELLRESGRNFMYTVSTVGGKPEALHGLYDICNEIASLKYEGSEGIGGLVIAPTNHRNIKMTLRLKDPIRLRSHRKVRKFLELVDGESYIISDASLIYGLGKLTGKYNPKDENIFVINFKNHLKWELTHDENILMALEYGLPSLPKERINRDKFYKDFPRLFKNISQRQIDDLWDVTLEATKQEHGAMLIISGQAELEAKRLGNQCFPIEPIKLNEKLIKQTTSIDGGVLVDENSTCHAIGVILDGIATENGDPSRGSRYNSAIRYYEHVGNEAPLVIVVVSEDGMINLIPDLIPQIKHSDITKVIEDFKNLLNANELNSKAFHKGMDFFKSNNFYLTSEECDIINKTRKEIQSKYLENSKSLQVVYSDLVPNPNMNEHYYLEE